MTLVASLRRVLRATLDDEETHLAREIVAHRRQPWRHDPAAAVDPRVETMRSGREGNRRRPWAARGTRQRQRFPIREIAGDLDPSRPRRDDAQLISAPAERA